MAGPRRPRQVKQPLDVHERALRLLSVRPRSRRELQTRLLRAGFDGEEVNDELGRLEGVGLLDDGRFAHELAEHQVRVRRAGRRGVASALAAKGIDRATIEQVLDDVPGDDVERALELARIRAGRLANVPPERAYARLVSFLVRRGHDPATARQAARSALRVRAEDA